MNSKITKTLQFTLALVGAVSMLVGVPANAQTANTIPSSTPTFGIDVTSCLATFDWTTYIADQRAGRTTSNPYTDKGCVRQNGVQPNAGVKYADFTVGQAATKQAYANMPVIGIFQNGNYAAQALNTFDANGQVVGSKPAVNRAVAQGLDSIFTPAQLQEIYSTGGQRTGMPRVFSTGPDTYTTNAQNQRVYQGGWCEVVNGQIRVRTTRAGQPFDASLYGRNPATPSTSCARTVNGTRLPAVEDRNLQVYQFVYELRYPTASECLDWFGVDADTCNQFFQNRYGRDLAGNTNTQAGSKLVSTYTFYGTFDDKYSKWVGWVNPDVNGPRAQSQQGFVRGYDGYSVYEF